MGYVYQINFPDNTIYIGGAVDLNTHLGCHWSDNTYVSAKIRRLFCCKENLKACTLILYMGDDYRNQEQEFIREAHKNHPETLINKYVCQEERNKKHIKVDDDVYDKLVSIKQTTNTKTISTVIRMLLEWKK